MAHTQLAAVNRGTVEGVCNLQEKEIDSPDLMNVLELVVEKTLGDDLYRYFVDDSLDKERIKNRTRMENVVENTCTLGLPGDGFVDCDCVCGEDVGQGNSRREVLDKHNNDEGEDTNTIGEESTVNSSVGENDHISDHIRHVVVKQSDSLRCTASICDLKPAPVTKDTKLLTPCQVSSIRHSNDSKTLTRPPNKLSLSKKGRKAFSTQTIKLQTIRSVNRAENFLNLDEILQASPQPLPKVPVKKLSCVSSDLVIPSSSSISSSCIWLGPEMAGKIVEHTIDEDKKRVRRTRLARVSSVLPKPEFVTGDWVWSSEDEVEGTSGGGRVVKQKDEDWQPHKVGRKPNKSGEGGGRSENKRRVGKRRLFSNVRDYMDDSAESDNEENHQKEDARRLQYSRTRKGVLSTVEKLRKEGSLSDRSGEEVGTPRQRRS